MATDPRRPGSGSDEPRPRLVDDALVGFTETRDVALIRLRPVHRMGLREAETLTLRARRVEVTA